MRPRARAPGPARSTHLLATLVAGSALLLGLETLAAQPATDTVTIESQAHGFSVALPAGCRREKGPGTVDAVCAPDLSAESSAAASAAGALLLSVTTEAIEGLADTSIAGLLERYSEAAFKAELPEAVCGEPNPARVKIENLSQSEEAGRLVTTADVSCAPVGFLQIPPRHARVRHVAGPDAVYRLVARAPAAEYDRLRPTIDAFLESFRPLVAEKGGK